MPSEARLENFWILIVKNSKILKKKYAKRSEAKKIRKKLDRAPKWSILGPQNLGSGGWGGPPGPPPGSASEIPNPCFCMGQESEFKSVPVSVSCNVNEQWDRKITQKCFNKDVADSLVYSIIPITMREYIYFGRR